MPRLLLMLLVSLAVQMNGAPSDAHAGPAHHGASEHEAAHHHDDGASHTETDELSDETPAPGEPVQAHVHISFDVAPAWALGRPIALADGRSFAQWRQSAPPTAYTRPLLEPPSA